MRCIVMTKKANGSAGVVSLYMIFQEIDRISTWQAQQEAVLLRRGYLGSIENAGCTVQRDAVLIRAEIGEAVTAVDTAVDVLLEAGMSTRSLRQAKELGVDLLVREPSGTSDFYCPWNTCRTCAGKYCHTARR
eukprot:TRINITY_DN22936_c0_g1_i1.p2 TRINITY_DN22936_c0_g1~~TRINITY_DN22936_c0_g1_i1.p2  ORF type:complete len:133 (-),score=8.45 TRINITY_DN22936_c0_g1_i1:819-1217(-)